MSKREYVRFASGEPRSACRYANIPQLLLLKGEGEQYFKVPLLEGEGCRVRADKGNMLPEGDRKNNFPTFSLLISSHSSFNGQ